MKTKGIIGAILAAAVCVGATTCLYVSGSGTTPDYTDFPAAFYDGANWATLTGDGGDAVVNQADGSIAFNYTNKSYNLGSSYLNQRMSFVIKATGDWSIRFRASESSNNGTYYQLGYAWSTINLQRSDGGGKWLAKCPADTTYAQNKWTRIDIEFVDATGGTPSTTIKIYIDGKKVDLVAGDAFTGVSITNGNFVDTNPYQSGDYFILKTNWNGNPKLAAVLK